MGTVAVCENSCGPCMPENSPPNSPHNSYAAKLNGRLINLKFSFLIAEIFIYSKIFVRQKVLDSLILQRTQENKLSSIEKYSLQIFVLKELFSN